MASFLCIAGHRSLIEPRRMPAMRAISFTLALTSCCMLWYAANRSDISSPASSDEAGAAIKPVDVNMHDFMEGMFQAPYRRLKTAMESEPMEPPQWKALRSDALILAEGCNLLLTRPPEKEIEDWKKHSIAARQAGEQVVLAGKAKDYAKARASYETMLNHCNSCHRQFENGKHILAP
jgi:hypothetical protein